MSRSKARLAADWFAKLRINATTQEVEHEDILDVQADVPDVESILTSLGAGTGIEPTDKLSYYDVTDGTWKQATIQDVALVGPQGPQGPAGADGINGATGLKGDKGDKGDTGAAGADGAAGPQGPQGPTGPQGPQGATGPQGPAGVTTTTTNYNTTANTVGSYGYFYTTQRAPSVAYGSFYYYPGTDVAGSYLRWASESVYYNAPSGTWRCMGFSKDYLDGNKSRPTGSNGYRTLFVRIS